jgi:hypothetical protein
MYLPRSTALEDENPLFGKQAGNLLLASECAVRHGRQRDARRPKWSKEVDDAQRVDRAHYARARESGRRALIAWPRGQSGERAAAGDGIDCHAGYAADSRGQLFPSACGGAESAFDVG